MAPDDARSQFREKFRVDELTVFESADWTVSVRPKQPVLGSLVSVVLSPFSKVFECEVTGTLADPKITPVYLPFPKLLAVPLHPIRSVEELFSSPATNSPALK